MAVSLYRMKKALLAPRTAYMRHQEGTTDPFARAALDLHYYRRPMYDFMRARAANPDLLYRADIDEHSVVLDVGAYDGEWSQQILERYGSHVYAFEPDPYSFRRLVKRLGDDPRVTTLEYGLGARDERATMALDAMGSSVSTTKGHFGQAEVQLRDAAVVLDELGVERVDLLKANIEGGEYDLFDRLIESRWLPRIDRVSVQFHEWLPHAYRRRRLIRRALRRTHEVQWDYPFVWEYWRRPEV